MQQTLRESVSMSYGLSVYAAALLGFEDLLALVRSTVGLDVEGGRYHRC